MSAGWRPEPGDTVSGKVVDADRIEGGYGAYLVLAIDTGSAVVDVHAFHDTLVRQLRKHAVQIGGPRVDHVRRTS